MSDICLLSPSKSHIVERRMLTKRGHRKAIAITTVLAAPREVDSGGGGCHSAGDTCLRAPDVTERRPDLKAT